MFYTTEWWHRTASRTLEDVPEISEEREMQDAAVIFFHAEEEDEEKRGGVLKKFLKNTKWIAGKFGTRNVVLHSFNHLSISKSSPEFARDLLAEIVQRLESSGYRVLTTPFGYFNEFRMHVAGDSLAKVFKSF